MRQTSTIFAPGTYAVGLKVYDRHGSSQQLTRTLTVIPAPTAVVQGGPARLTGKKVGVRVACPAPATSCTGELSVAQPGFKPARFSIDGGTIATVGVKASKAARKRIKRLGSIATTATAGDIDRRDHAGAIAGRHRTSAANPVADVDTSRLTPRASDPSPGSSWSTRATGASGRPAPSRPRSWR